MKRGSIQTRIVKPLLIWAVVIWCCSTAATLILTHRAVNVYFDEALKETAERLLPMALDDYFSGQAGMPRDSVDSQFSFREFDRNLRNDEDHPEHLLYRLIDNQAARAVIRSHSRAPEAIGPTQAGFFHFAEFRLYNEVTPDNRFTLQILEAERIRESTTLRLMLPVLIALTVAIPLLGWILFYLTRRELQPLSAMSQAISAHNPIDPENLQLEGLTDELESIQQHINHLLDKTRHVLARERYLASNLAHELRTPLAVVLAELEQLQAHLSQAPTQDAVSGIKGQLQRMNRIADKLLELARSERADPRNRQQANLLQIVRLLLGDMGRGSADVKIDIPAELTITTDIDAMGILIKNVLENAFKYSRSDHANPIEITWADHQLIVTNPADPIPPELRTRLLQRGVNRGTQGQGLGLSIAETIATRLGFQFQIEVESVNAHRCLFRAIVHFSPETDRHPDQ